MLAKTGEPSKFFSILRDILFCQEPAQELHDATLNYYFKG